ncbi:MAG: hypothetical protein ABIJ56_20040 [Pseudomonadota bacterium]
MKCLREYPTKILCMLGFLAAAFLLPSPSPAGGFEYGVQGVETVARSGANVAKVSGPEALYLNVAGIGGGDGIRILLDSNFLHVGIEANLYGNGADSWRIVGVGEMDYVSVSHSTDVYPGKMKMFAAPYLGITFPVPKFKKLTIGLGVFGPAALGAYDFPETLSVEHEGLHYTVPSPQRYDVIYENVLFYWPTIALSYKLTERLTIGAGFQWGIVNFEFTQAINNGTVSTPTSYINDTLCSYNAWDWFVPAGVFGLKWNPIDEVEMGFSLRVSDGIEATGEVVATSNMWRRDPDDPTQPDPDNPTVYSDDPSLTWMDEEPYKRPQGGLKLAWPTTVYRFGIRYRHPNKNAPASKGRVLYPWESEIFDIELDFFMEQNHVVESMELQMNGYIPYGLGAGEAVPFRPNEEHPELAGKVKIRRNWKDTISVRLGGSVNLLKGALTINAGAFYESPTVDDEDVRLDAMNTQRWGVSFGLQGRYFEMKTKKNTVGLEIGLSYIHFFYPDIHNENGRINHLTYLDVPGTVINNGDINFSLDILTAGIRITVL